jgi:hypothetical protein
MGQCVKSVMGIDVAEIPGKGRGVIATQPFEIGDILERAPVIVLGAPDTEIIVDTVLLFYHYLWGAESTAIACGYGSLYNHSTEPNADYQKNLEANELIFVAIRPIAAGDEITINYNGNREDKTPITFDGNGWYKS